MLPVGTSTRLISSHAFQPTSAIQSSFVPGRRVMRYGLRRPIATMKSSSAAALPTSGLSAGATGVAPLTSSRSSAPSSVVASPVVIRS
jgi:hypothetical protein